MRRRFSSKVRRHEWLDAGGACRICGGGRELELAHVLSRSEAPAWERQGTDRRYWASDSFVSSARNCLLLCHECHRRVDSVQGRQRCGADYLFSLKDDRVTCSALVSRGGEFRRCRRSRTPKSRRCARHCGGGLELFDVPARRTCAIL